MNKTTVISFLLLLLNVYAAFGNINSIDPKKIENSEKYLSCFTYLKDNQTLYDHWSQEWKQDISKEEVITKLKEIYSTFGSIPGTNTELLLLKGDIAHYLYNLDLNNYNDSALNYYSEAIKAAPDDYRGYWFLANHYAQSNVSAKAIELFLKAEQLKPADKQVDFWEEYTMAAAFAHMPSHAVYGMDKVKSIRGMAGKAENQVGESIFKQLTDINRDNSYKKEEIWSAEKGDKVGFVCRPLGIKIFIDSTWNVTVYNYAKHTSGFVIEPPVLKDKKGKEISYTIAILMKVVNDSDKLEDYINKSSQGYKNKTKIRFSDKYKDLIAYEIREKGIYQATGGGHLYSIGIERTMPEYPGLLLENPVAVPSVEAGKVNYFTSTAVRNRFKGKIFYNILLDTCEDIHDLSFAIFKSLFENQIIIE